MENHTENNCVFCGKETKKNIGTEKQPIYSCLTCKEYWNY